MNTTDPIWYAQIHFSGSSPTQLHGNFREIVRQFSLMAVTANPRRLATGKRIELVLSTMPIDSKQQIDKVGEVEESLAEHIPCEDEPLAGESYADYLTRKMAEGVPKTTALILADDWFGTDISTRLREWLSDSRADRFRFLNSNNKAYESAMPGEYLELKNYVQATYPEFCAAIQFRIA